METIISPTIIEGVENTTPSEVTITEEKLTPEQQEYLDKLLADQSKYEYYKNPLRKKSVCDVYRNNKVFLKNISFLYSNNYEEDSELRKKYGAETKESADEMFEKAHEGLSEKRYNTNKKYYESFRSIFN